jgi:hypothetical protein
MVELLLSMAILALVVVGMADLFSFTANSWSRQMASSGGSIDVSEAADCLREDLESAFPNRPVAYQTFSPPAGQVLSEGLQRYLGRKLLLPFEINRKSGRGLDRSFRNADPSDKFSQLAFVAIQPGASSLLPETFYPQRHGSLANPSLPPDARPTPSDACLVGYYVAYTPDAPFAGETHSSMKLFRHFRPGGTSLGQAQASSTIRCVSDALNRRLIPQLTFANRDLPFLLAYHASGMDTAKMTESPSQAPWPDFSTNTGGAPVDRSNSAAWFNPDHAMFDQLPADHPLAINVVAFTATPYKRIRNGQALEVLGAAQLNQYLGLPSSGEWPVLVVPDLVEIELAVVDPNTSALMTSREDWLVDWSGPPKASDTTVIRQIRRNVSRLHFRVSLHPSPPIDLEPAES